MKYTIAKLPVRFISDCEDCDVDIGEFDYSTTTLIATEEQLAELVNRTEFYAEDHWEPGECPPEIRRAAKALLKKLPRKGVTREPHYSTPMYVLNDCIIQATNDDSLADELKWVVIAPEGHRIEGYGSSFKNCTTLKQAEWIARHSIEKGEPC